MALTGFNSCTSVDGSGVGVSTTPVDYVLKCPLPVLTCLAPRSPRPIMGNRRETRRLVSSVRTAWNDGEPTSLSGSLL